MKNEAKEKPVFSESSVTLKCNLGPVEKPCLITRFAPGLCINNDGINFAVTHMASGLKLGDLFERFGNAAILLARLQQIAKEHGVSWEMSQDELSKVRQENEVFRKAISEETQTMPFSTEFPWEEEHPLDTAFEILGIASVDAAYHKPRQQ